MHTCTKKGYFYKQKKLGLGTILFLIRLTSKVCIAWRISVDGYPSPSVCHINYKHSSKVCDAMNETLEFPAKLNQSGNQDVHFEKKTELMQGTYQGRQGQSCFLN